MPCEKNRPEITIAQHLLGSAPTPPAGHSESTDGLLGNLFELEDLGAKDVKGISEPVRAWAAVRQSSVESRFGNAQWAPVLAKWLGGLELCAKQAVVLNESPI
jgi:hypothetical protein